LKPTYDTVILLFSRPEPEEAGAKRFSLRGSANRRLIRRLNQEAYRTAVATGLPVVCSSRLITHDGLFADQLSQAISAVFAQGAERVICIGNDCPNLTVANLTAAAVHLQRVPVVLGPSRRGGLYLLGLTRALYETYGLQNLPWQTPELASAAQRLFQDYRLVLLPTLADINSLRDLRLYRPLHPAASLLLHAFRQWLAALKSIRADWAIVRPPQRFLTRQAFRGPPSC